MLWPLGAMRLTTPSLRGGAASVAFLAQAREDGRSRGLARTRPRGERREPNRLIALTLLGETPHGP